MNTQHTPAPWVVSDNAVFGNHGIIKPLIADLDGRFDDDESKANARLIAGAPELLDACRCALADLEGIETEHSMYPTLLRLQAAIAKASGGSA